MKKADVAAYLTASASVEGWFFPVDAYAFAMIDEIQKSEKIGGNLFEIGVHHGKTAIMLARMARVDETVGVCDVFGNQLDNVDRSGEGSRDLFLANMRAHTVVPPERLSVFEKRSSTLTADETSINVRFFHIDGGHRAQDVFADLVTADRSVAHEGVVAVDDLFNSNWPGVSEGFYNFVAMRPDVFLPIFIGGNKVYFTRRDATEIYEKYFADAVQQWSYFDPGPYTFEFKEWLGRPVLTAVRSTWVDIDPISAARAHLGPATWKERLRTLIGR